MTLDLDAAGCTIIKCVDFGVCSSCHFPAVWLQLPHLVHADLNRPQRAVVKTQWANARRDKPSTKRLIQFHHPPTSAMYLALCTGRVCSRGVQGSKPQGLDPCPPGPWPRGDPTPAAAGQSTSKSPNTGPKGRIPRGAASAPGAQHTVGLGTRCHSLRLRHLPASGPRLPDLLGAASLRSRHRSLALNLVSRGARGAGCFPEAAASSHPAPPAYRPHPRGLSAGGLTSCSPANPPAHPIGSASGLTCVCEAGPARGRGSARGSAGEAPGVSASEAFFLRSGDSPEGPFAALVFAMYSTLGAG